MRKSDPTSNFVLWTLGFALFGLSLPTAMAHVPSHQMLVEEFGVEAAPVLVEQIEQERQQEEEEAPVVEEVALESTIEIRTTAYTHTESDHLQYGRKSAAGTTLKHGSVTSAAADWSKFPLGTKFKIKGKDGVYIVDDYGSALVGKDVIDLYEPTRSRMNAWGARMVEIEVVEWGCFDKSLKLLKPRAKYAKHVREMVRDLEDRG